MANIEGGQDIFERGFSWLKSKLPSGQDITNAYGQNQGTGSVLAGTKGSPDSKINFNPNINWFGGNTLGEGGYGDVNLSNPGPNIQRPEHPIEEDAMGLDEEDYGDGPDTFMEAAINNSEFDTKKHPSSGNITNPSSNFDINSAQRKAMEAQNKVTNTSGPFRNLFQKMKGGLGNIGSAQFDEEAFGKDGKTPNPNYGKYLRDPEDPSKIIGKGKGVFGKEGGFMSKFGTGKGAMKGLMGGLGAGLGSMGGEGGMQAPEEYMYQNPWEGIE